MTRREIKPKETVILLERAKTLLQGTPSAGARSRALMALHLAAKVKDTNYYDAREVLTLLGERKTAEEYLEDAITVEKRVQEDA